MSIGRNAPCPCGSGKKYKKCCLHQDEQRVLQQAAPQDLKAMLFDYIEMEFDWDHYLYQVLARNIVNSMYPQYEPEVIAAAISLWNLYANEAQPIVRKAGVIEAAIEYCVAQMLDLPLTQAELAAKYGVSAGTISKRAQEILSEDWLSDTILQANSSQPSLSGSSRLSGERALHNMTSLVEGKEFDSQEQLNEFINSQLSNGSRVEKNSSLSPKKQAQEILYDAWEEPSVMKRIQLANQALQLYPDSPDAYNILAESIDEDVEELTRLYKQGKEAGERDLGLRCFHENRGHFWGLLYTRPYMRSKEGYANCLWIAGQADKAAKEFQEMLELNPNDNQGVRYSLISIFIELRQFEKALRLLKTYDENCAYMNYSRVLIEYGKNGLSSRLENLLDSAIQQNAHVIDFLVGRKKLPRQEPEFYGFGDTSEAVVYVNANYHLWQREAKLVRWLTNHKA